MVTLTVFAEDIVELQQTVVAASALTFAKGDKTGFGLFVNGRTHQQTPLVMHKGYQYTTFFDAKRQICVGRRKLPSGKWQLIRFDDYKITSNDSHNAAVIGICEKDGTIHLMFDHHVHALHYRVSKVGAADNPDKVSWNADLFGPVTDRLEGVGPIKQVTYPRLFNAPNGNLMFYYRYITSANGDGMIHEYDGDTHAWTQGLGRFIARDMGTYKDGEKTSKYRYSYLNNITYGGGRIHVSWIWRDRFKRTRVRNNHDVCYAYSDDHGRTWKNSAGEQIGTTGTENVIHLDSPGIIVGSVNCGEGLANQNGHYAYPDGSIHIVVLRNNERTQRRTYYHYWRDSGGVWKNKTLRMEGGRPKIVGDSDGNLFLVHANDRRLRILKGIPNNDKSEWKWNQLYTLKNVPIGSEVVADFTRWKKERVLSVYGQTMPKKILDYGSGSSFDGLPSALYVVDAHVSTHAVAPTPSADAENVPLKTSLRWISGLGAVAHHVYVGISKEAVQMATTDSSEYRVKTDKPVFLFPRKLQQGMTIYWRVDEEQANGKKTKGLVWKFTTQK